jgi:hypothetical protein
MAPCLTTAVDPPSCVSAYSHIPSPIQKPSSPTPPRVSVGVSPIRVQRTPTRTFVSRGLSPVPMIDILPPDIAAMLMETQNSQAYAPYQTPIRLRRLAEVVSPVSVTSSESENENERPLTRSRTRAHSPEIIPETQVWSDEELPVRLYLLLFRIYLLTQSFQTVVPVKLEKASSYKRRKVF